MKFIGFLISCVVTIHAIYAFDGRLLKHFTEHREGGILDIIKRPKIPGINVHLERGKGGFGAGASIGSFGFGFGFGAQYVPPGAGVNLPPKEPLDPDYEPVIPDHIPDPKPQIPRPKPQIPGVTWEQEKGKPRPNWEEYEEEHKRYDDVEYPKHESFEESKKDTRPNWDDIGEMSEDNSDTKSEKLMNGDLIKDGLIQPRLKNRRNKRYIESHIYHVPLLFQSNAKPFHVKVKSSYNSLVKESSGK